jgi:hypothetical protein
LREFLFSDRTRVEKDQAEILLIALFPFFVYPRKGAKEAAAAGGIIIITIMIMAETAVKLRHEERLRLHDGSLFFRMPL